MNPDPVTQEPAENRPLDDVMLAMDVVDTLRHQQLLIERELNSDDRDRRMIERLRSIYASQGIEVPDHVLAEGVDALKEDRFVYTPPPRSFHTWLAAVYVSRGRWGKPLLVGLTVLITAWIVYVFFVSGPAEREREALPGQLDAAYQLLSEQAVGPVAQDRARSLLAQGQSTVKREDVVATQDVVSRMAALQSEIEQEYEIRIVSRAGERSGVWRIPPNNPDARNYYIIVEAITPEGDVVEVSVVNEEDGATSRVRTWGLRVDEEVYEKIAADKLDDGIIQQNLFGSKRRGYLVPEYSVPTTGRAITAW